MTAAQRRLYEVIRSECARVGEAEYWPTVNDWVKDRGAINSLAFHNITRTVEALLKTGLVTLSDEGYFQLVEEVR
jgi:hypothetical protein